MKSKKVICPRCGCVTLKERGYYEICHACYWESEPIALECADEVFGANGISLNKAKNNYQRFQEKSDDK